MPITGAINTDIVVIKRAVSSRSRIVRDMFPPEVYLTADGQIPQRLAAAVKLTPPSAGRREYSASILGPSICHYEVE